MVADHAPGDGIEWASRGSRSRRLHLGSHGILSKPQPNWIQAVSHRHRRILSQTSDHATRSDDMITKIMALTITTGSLTT